MWRIVFMFMLLCFTWLQTKTKTTIGGSKERVWDEVHLLVQWHDLKDSVPQRHDEYVKTLRRNLANKYITHVHMLQGNIDTPDTFLLFQQVKGYLVSTIVSQELLFEKLQIHLLPFQGRLSAKHAFQFASKHLPGKTCMLANLDIYFDDTLALLMQPTIDLDSQHAYFLSRYEDIDENHPKGAPDQCNMQFFEGSHDTIVFVAPLPSSVVERCDIQIGSWGIESRIMWEFEQTGISVRNPCLDIRSWHVHHSRFKSSWMPQVNDPKRSSIAHPTRLFASAYLPFHSDFSRRPWDPKLWPDGAVVMLQGMSSTLCLFSRDDGKFGHAPCDVGSIIQHFIWTPPIWSAELARSRTLFPPNATFLPRFEDGNNDNIVSSAGWLVGRETGLCVSVEEQELLTHRPCGLTSLIAGTCPDGASSSHNVKGRWTDISCSAPVLQQIFYLTETNATVRIVSTDGTVCLGNSLMDRLDVINDRNRCSMDDLDDELLWRVQRLFPSTSLLQM